MELQSTTRETLCGMVCQADVLNEEHIAEVQQVAERQPHKIDEAAQAMGLYYFDLALDVANSSAGCINERSVRTLLARADQWRKGDIGQVLHEEAQRFVQHLLA